MNDHVGIDFIVNLFPGWFIVQCIVTVRQGFCSIRQSKIFILLVYHKNMSVCLFCFEIG